MDLRIGIADTAQPLTVTLPEGTDRASLKAAVETAMQDSSAVLWLTDDKGREVAVASARLTYVEIGPASAHPIGFG